MRCRSGATKTKRCVVGKRLAMRCRSADKVGGRFADSRMASGMRAIPMDDATYFERLAPTVIRLARHPSFPAKQQAVDLCLEDIDDLSLAGRITVEQAGVLRETLMGSPCRAA